MKLAAGNHFPSACPLLGKLRDRDEAAGRRKPPESEDAAAAAAMPSRATQDPRATETNAVPIWFLELLERQCLGTWGEGFLSQNTVANTKEHRTK